MKERSIENWGIEEACLTRRVLVGANADAILWVAPGTV